MYRIDIASASNTLPTPAGAGTAGYFTDGNPGTGAAPTIVPADFLNRVQEELMSFLTAASITPSKTTYTQVAKAVQSGKLNYAIDTSVSPNTITASLSQAPGTLTDGLPIWIKVANTNNGATVVNLNGGGNVSVVTKEGAAFAGGEFVAGGMYKIVYDLTNTRWQAPTSTPTTSAFTTGDLKPTFKASADTGWVLMNNGSIGNAASSATARANADTAALFTLLWTNCADADAPVSSGRGGSAAADFAANKRITMPLMLGRALLIAGAGSGLTSRALGHAFGEETHTLTSSESAALTYTSSVSDPGHIHAISAVNAFSNGTPLEIAEALQGSGADSATQSATTGISVSTSSNAGGGAHNNMQPSVGINIMIKL